MKKISLFALLLLSTSSIYSQTTELWAGARWGGLGLGSGIIYKTDGNGNCAQLAFAYADTLLGYSGYGGLLAASNGMLYGTTIDGGLYNDGVIFEINPVTGVYTKKWDFNSSLTGSFPLGNLLQASNGQVFGLAQTGGTNNMGVLFEYDLALDTCIARVHFDGTSLGSGPTNYLIESNGKLYGVTYAGGLSNNGTLFEYDITSHVFTKRVDFDGINGRKSPLSVVMSSNGKIFGTTGIINGIIFSFDLNTSVLTKLCDFTNTTGYGGNGGLIEAPNGRLYGLAPYGGDSLIGGGTLFEFDTSANIISHVVNAGAVGTYTYYANGTLFLASNGKMYGSSDFDYFEYDYINNIFTSKLDLNATFSASEPRGMRFVEIARPNSEYVWPGDCNGDLVADNLDFLSIGLAYNETGPARFCGTNDWTAQQADNWATAVVGINSHHADANGDSVVNADDSLAITLNYGLTHPLRPAAQAVPTDFYLVPDHTVILPGDTIRYDIMLTSGIPVDSLYGIAFSLSFDPSLADSIDGSIQYVSSSLGIAGSNMISMEKDFFQAGAIHAAVTRTNHLNATALSGSLGTFTLVVPVGITAQNVPLIITPHDILGVTANVDIIAFNGIADTLIINAPSGFNNILSKNDFTLYPNPANTRMTIRFRNDVIRSVELFDAAGRMVYSSAPSSREAVIETSSLNAGAYLIIARTEKGIVHQRLFITHE